MVYITLVMIFNSYDMERVWMLIFKIFILDWILPINKNEKGVRLKLFIAYHSIFIKQFYPAVRLPQKRAQATVLCDRHMRHERVTASTAAYGVMTYLVLQQSCDITLQPWYLAQQLWDSHKTHWDVAEAFTLSCCMRHTTQRNLQSWLCAFQNCSYFVM